MGIRVHKSMGYGIDDLKFGKKDYKIVDPRIHQEKFNELHEKSYEYGWVKFLKWMEDEKPHIMDFYKRVSPSRGSDDAMYGMDWKLATHLLEGQSKEKDSWDLGSSVIWDSEYGIGKIMLFVPPGHRNWARYDDTLDYYRETLTGKSRNWYKMLNTGIYPYLGWLRYREAPPGVWKDKADEKKNKFLDPAAYSQLVGWWDKKVPAIAKGDALKHFLNDYRPVIPLELHMALWFFRDAFVNVDEFTNSLRPMMYVHWG